MTLHKRLLFAFALLALAFPANAAFKNVTFNRMISCKNNTAKATLKFIPGAPNGTYSATLNTEGEASSDLTIEGETVGEAGVTKEFKIPKDEKNGLDFEVAYDVNALISMGSFENFDIPFVITPGDSTTSQTGFGQATGSLTITDEGCDGDEGPEEPVEESGLDDLVSGAESEGFGAINVNDLVTAEQDLKVNLTYKIPTTAYNIFVGDLKDGEDITTKAKELAEKFGIKLDLKRLKKEAGKELNKAAKGKKGQEKKDAIEAAKQTGFNKLLSEILIKLPKVKDAADKEAAAKIRKAKKKKVLEALEVEVSSITEDEENSITCLTFTITLPAKVCAKDSGSKTLILAGQEINFANLEPGESLTVAIPVKVIGTFKEFFGTENKKGKINGKTTLDLTLTNPAE